MVKSFDLKNQKISKESIKIFGLFKEILFIVIILNRELNLCAKEESFLISKIYIIERNSSKKKFTMLEEVWRKAKTSEAKKN